MARPSERDQWEEPFIRELEETGCSQRRAAYVAGINRNTPRRHLGDQTFRARVEQAIGTGRQRRGLLGLALALLLASPAAAIESEVFSLGQTGLSLTVRLRKWTEATGLWADVSGAPLTGIDVVDEGNGEYSLADLPAATGTDRYAATVALTSDATRGLLTYTYGARPGVRLVWQEEIALPSSPLVFRRGDSFGALSLVVTRGLPEAACDATATMDAASQQTNAALFSDRAATVTNCELDATSGTYGATITADLTAGDLDTVGRYAATATLCYEPGSCQTLPGANLLRFEVVRALGE